MKEWLKDHALEGIGIIVSIVGIKGLYDFWSSICELFRFYKIEAAFACVLSAAIAVLVTLYVSRRERRKKFAEKDKEIDFLKKQIEAADNAKELKNQEPDGIEILRGDDVLNLIRMLTDNQKSALAYFYGEGGSAEADSMDAELIELSRLGLLLQPPFFAPGMTAKWVVPPNVNKILDDHPDLLEGFLGPLPVSIETLQELPPSIARHIVNMAENGKDVPFQKITKQENESLLNGDGIFERPKMVFAGSARDAEFYRLTKEWRLFLSDEENLNKAKIVAGMK